jgi:group II intron reverse transcriptase/maturase
VFSKENIETAIYKVRSNKGAPGVDGMTTGQLESWWKEHGGDEERFIRSLHYRPLPVRKVEIPKPNGGIRALGIPSVKDRMIQQAVLQVIQPIVDPQFSEHSFGFRPERSAHQAIEQARRYDEDGYTTVVDIDLKSYFDTVNHDILMMMVERRFGITDPIVLHIIRRSLMAGIMEGGITTQRAEGTPQGGPLSPLLSNIYLDVFDRELERRDHAFVRYADDCNIYVRSRRAGERVMLTATDFLEKKLKLVVNTEKSEVGSPSKLKFLGFSLGKDAEGTFIRVHAASVKRLKDKIRRITKRNRGIALARMFRELRQALTGWINYFGIAKCKGLCEATDEWLRSRIRQYHWKQWKRQRTKIRKLKGLGVERKYSFAWGLTKKSYWRIANSPVLKTTLTNEYLKKQGLFSLADHYTEKCLSKRTAVYRTVRTVV